MNNVRVYIAISAIVLLLACALQSTEAAKVNWRENYRVQEYLLKRPMLKRMTEGPLGGILDLIIDIILIIVDILLGGVLAPLQSQMTEMQGQVDQMGELLGMKG